MKITKLAVYNGFTLAEVLITLGVIGVVAAMTIPTLMNKTGNAELVTAFKKEYSVLSSAWQQLITDNGDSVAGAYTTADAMLNALCTKLQCTKKCLSTDDKTQCSHDRDWQKLGNGAAWQSLLGPSAVMVDGATFSLTGYSPTCTSTRYENITCSALYIDTNGFKKPNIMGRDIFEIFVNQVNITPQGVAGTDLSSQLLYYCGSSVTTFNGATCGARILLENGMNY